LGCDLQHFSPKTVSQVTLTSKASNS
jgi:hypothetical protein